MLVFCLLASSSFGQQTAFVNSDKTKIDLPTESKVSFSIEDLEGWTTENIAEQVTAETQWIEIKFYCDPEFSDADKRSCVNDVLAKLKKLELIKSICQPKVISLAIGEFTFMNEKETQANKKSWDKMVNVNLTNAWKELNNDLIRMFPQTKFYAEVIGW